MTWYQQGYDGLKAEEDRIASLGTPDRLWLPPETSRDILFVDDDPFCIFEHNPKMNGSFKNWLTCLRNIEDEVVCCEFLGVKGRYYAGYYTVVDFHEYTDKGGKKHQYEVKLLLAKFSTLKMLKMKKEQRGKLAGSVFKTTRYDKKSPGVGSEFEYQRDLDPEKLDKLFTYATFRGKKLTELWAKATDAEKSARVQRVFQAKATDNTLEAKIVPFNYFEVLKPIPSKDMKTLLKGSKIESWDDDSFTPSSSGGGQADEEVPF